jgi:hypothetical protein
VRTRSTNRLTDFGLLRRFELYGSITVEELQTLASMAAGNKFHSLQELGLVIPSFRSDPPYDLNETAAAADRSASLFLRAVPPLEVLKLDGGNLSRETFEAVLRRHGHSLRKLRLFSPFGDDVAADVDVDLYRVRLIQQRCPRLEVVQLRVRRRQGGPEEVAVYRTLGRLPRLRHATLVLDCHVPLNDATDDLERLRKGLINLAVDENLTRAIFHKIFGGSNSPFQRLRLETCSEDMFNADWGELQDWAIWIGRSWVCTKNETRGEIRVHEDHADQAEQERNGIRDDLQVMRDELEQFNYDWFDGTDLWTELWPRRAEDWRDDWHSFPLPSEELEADMSDEKSEDD